VHAWGQVLGFDAPEGSDIDTLARRLTRLLGPEIVVRSAEVASPDFDARHAATGRRYRYSVLHRDLPDPFLADTTWWVPEPLDVRAMQAACDPLIGIHDFGAFCRRQGDRSLVRDLRSAEWLVLDGDILRFDVEASSFCQQMVRSLVGTLVDVGRGKRTAADVMAALRHPERENAGPVAPPHGLVLWEVLY
jgi:tRNA pseudouridine38-40 synthase